MTRHPETRPTVILVAIDDTPASGFAVDSATALAGRLGDVQLNFAYVAGPLVVTGGLGPLPDPSLGEMLERGQALLTAMRARFPDLAITTHCMIGSPATEIVRLAKELEADVVVVGSHNRRTLERWLLGSVSEQIVRQVGCAVVVARPKDHRSAPAPAIEPPCPACEATQKATAGERLWCVRHAERHAHAHVHYESPPTFGVGSTFLRPEG